MMKMKMKKMLAMLLAVCLVVQMVLFPCTAEDTAAAETDSLTPATSSNAGDQDYSTWSSPVYSYLVNTDDGFMRVEYIEDSVVVEYYDSEYNLTAQSEIECEMDLFGGFYAGDDAYYLVFGQENQDEDDSLEVIRVVKYSKDWERQADASIYGSNNITDPFAFGSLRMTEANGFLYVYTCRAIYTTADGARHQVNLKFVVRESDMEVTVESIGASYCSHSFNQFIIADDEGNLITADHGDAYPRSAFICKFDDKAGDSAVNGTTTAATQGLIS